MTKKITLTESFKKDKALFEGKLRESSEKRKYTADEARQILKLLVSAVSKHLPHEYVVSHSKVDTGSIAGFTEPNIFLTLTIDPRDSHDDSIPNIGFNRGSRIIQAAIAKELQDYPELKFWNGWDKGFNIALPTMQAKSLKSAPIDSVGGSSWGSKISSNGVTNMEVLTTKSGMFGKPRKAAFDFVVKNINKMSPKDQIDLLNGWIINDPQDGDPTDKIGYLIKNPSPKVKKVILDGYFDGSIEEYDDNLDFIKRYQKKYGIV